MAHIFSCGVRWTGRFLLIVANITVTTTEQGIRLIYTVSTITLSVYLYWLRAPVDWQIYVAPCRKPCASRKTLSQDRKNLTKLRTCVNEEGLREGETGSVRSMERSIHPACDEAMKRNREVLGAWSSPSLREAASAPNCVFAPTVGACYELF